MLTCLIISASGLLWFEQDPSTMSLSVSHCLRPFINLALVSSPAVTGESTVLQRRLVNECNLAPRHHSVTTTLHNCLWHLTMPWKVLQGIPNERLQRDSIYTIDYIPRLVQTSRSYIPWPSSRRVLTIFNKFKAFTEEGYSWVYIYIWITTARYDNSIQSWTS